MQSSSLTAPGSQTPTIPLSPLITPSWAYTVNYKWLWGKGIHDFATLKSHLQIRTSFVSLNIESDSLGRITEIGMAFLPFIGHEMPTDLKEFAKDYDVLSGSLRIRNRGQQEPKRFKEYFKWCSQEATTEAIGIGSVEAKMTEFLDYVRQFSHVEHITIIGFAIGTNLGYLFEQMPTIIEYMSHWVDIQHVIWDVDRLAGIPTNYCYLPSISDAMATFAFDNGYQAASSRYLGSNDVVHILALFTCIVHTPTSGIRIRLEQLRGEQTQTQQTLDADRPARKGSLFKSKRFIMDNYPFSMPTTQNFQSPNSHSERILTLRRAVLHMQDGNCPGPEIGSREDVQEYFSEYPIEAIGEDERHVDNHHQDRSRRCTGYYLICFNSEGDLAKFVNDNDQRALKSGRKLRVARVDRPYWLIHGVAKWKKRREGLNKELSNRLEVDSSMSDIDGMAIQPADLSSTPNLGLAAQDAQMLL